MPPYFYASANAPAELKNTRWLVQILADNLDNNAHVFVEFSIPSGRQIDFLILSSKGAYCIEAKNKEYVDVRVNGQWSCRNHDGTIIKEQLHNRKENPYQQAKANADSFKKWSAENRNILFKARERLPPLNPSRDIVGFKVFPAVVLPERPTGNIERDGWCYINCPPLSQERLMDRKWKESEFSLLADEIAGIAGMLGLRPVSKSDLLTPVDKRYCGALIEQMNRRIPLLDCYVPNRVALKTQQTNHPRESATVDHVLGEFSPGFHYMILAPGGHGKTTLCAHMCREFSRKHLSNNQAPLPVFVSLRDYRYQEGGLQDLIGKALLPLRIKPEDVIDFTRTERLFFIFDGLNEAPETQRDDVFRQLSDFASVSTQSMILVTSREMAPPETFSTAFTTVTLLPFSRDQVNEYLNRRGIPLSTLDEVPNDLTSSPLILSLLVKLGPAFVPCRHWKTAQLYHEISDALLKRELEKHQSQSKLRRYPEYYPFSLGKSDPPLFQA